jgi:flagellar hook assembly protein FlgD
VGVSGSVTQALDLRPAVPSPFSGSTSLSFTLARSGFAELSVFDVAGRRVATPFRGEAEAGPHTATWDGRRDDGQQAPAGVYRAVLRTAHGRVTRNVVLAR